VSADWFDTEKTCYDRHGYRLVVYRIHPEGLWGWSAYKGSKRVFVSAILQPTFSQAQDQAVAYADNSPWRRQQ
jgi:hypothetical protein